MEDMNFDVYGVDFDGTLCFSNWPELGEPNLELIYYMINRQKCGDKIILWTCRDGQQLEQAVEWCRNYGLYFDAINDNLPEIAEKYGGNSRKIFCDYYIDDRACSVLSEMRLKKAS